MASAAAIAAHTASNQPAGLLHVAGLSVEFPSSQGWVRVVDDVSFEVGSGETIGLVGESGSGKTVSAQAILGLSRAQGGRLAGGSITFDGRELTGLNERQMAKLRGDRIGMIFQQPVRSLDPAFTVGDQIAEVVRRHRHVSRRAAWHRAVEMLDRVHIERPAERARDYPHQFSGGMCQRVMIAIALACEPALLIADEPTTALDVTVQKVVLDMLREVQEDTGISILFISHDLAVIAEMADRIVVMYAGQVVEQGEAEDVFVRLRHPYTEGLLGSIPKVGDHRLRSIPGNAPIAGRLPSGCRFHPRCPYVDSGRCDVTEPSLEDLGAAQAVRCLRVHELALKGVSERPTS
jgi:peptide/nickel transport system ATP-binding protein/oligopeptide transport system ATP-binding protein